MEMKRIIIPYLKIMNQNTILNFMHYIIWRMELKHQINTFSYKESFIH